MKAFPLLICLALCACVDQDRDLHENGPEKGGKDYAAQFSNQTEINVNIQSEYPGSVYSIYYNYPYEEGSLAKEPYLVGKTPIQTTLKVPNDVKTLYILGNGKMIESQVKDLSINDKTPASRAESTGLTDKVMAAVNSKYFPESTNNVRGEDLYKCTDLVIAQTESTGEFNEAEVWLTYLSDGGFSRSNLYGKLWFYTYPTEKMNNLTLDDCTFYGKNAAGEIVKVDYAKNIRIKNRNEDNSGEYIFWSKEENAKTKQGEYTRIYLGKFSKGQNIGFVFRGTEERPQFTTPALNLSKTGIFAGDLEYVGKTIRYKDNSGSFKLEKQVSNGFIQHIQEDGFEGNVLGMENRTPTYNAYDGDYNDMLCLIESNPLALEPAEPITPPGTNDYTLEKGYYLFEDNYPDQGDFDFNDVVVEYSIISYNDSQKSKQISAKLLAYGCSFINEFGFKNAGKYVPFFTDIQGFKNVRGTADETNYPIATQTLNGEVEPYLYNGKGYIEKSIYHTDEYPYVLDIPISDTSSGKTFRWCIETKSISSAYSFIAPRKKDWYTNPQDENLLIKRE